MQPQETTPPYDVAQDGGVGKGDGGGETEAVAAEGVGGLLASVHHCRHHIPLQLTAHALTLHKPNVNFTQQGLLLQKQAFLTASGWFCSVCRPTGRTNEILGRLQRRRAAAGAQAMARERKVNLMRKYRTGELPDVQQLSIAAFLAPLGKSHRVSAL